MRLMTFDDACLAWRRLRDHEDETSFDIVEAAERVILDQRPTSFVEAAAMTEVLARSLSAGERDDGRDVDALHRLTSWLQDLAAH